MTTENKDPEVGPLPGGSRFSELDELQREIALRIKDNERFLKGFLSEDYADDEDDEADENADFEEL